MDKTQTNIGSCRGALHAPIKRRKNLRMKKHDYSSKAAYFITILTKNKKQVFGEVCKGKLILNDFGKIVRREWRRTESIRQEVADGGYVVMPNHFHGLLLINAGKGKRKQNLGAIVKGFKAAVTKAVREASNNSIMEVWHRNYYESIINNKKQFYRVKNYMASNPRNWIKDDYYAK